MTTPTLRKLAIPAAISLLLGVGAAAAPIAGGSKDPTLASPSAKAEARWLSGDFHQHTYLHGRLDDL